MLYVDKSSYKYNTVGLKGSFANTTVIPLFIWNVHSTWKEHVLWRISFVLWVMACTLCANDWTDLCNCKDSWIVFWFLIGLLTASTNARCVADVLFNWRVWLCVSRPVVWFLLLTETTTAWLLHVRVSVLSIITTERLRGVYDYVTYFTWYISLVRIRTFLVCCFHITIIPRSSFIAERPRDASCCWVFWLVAEGCSK